MLEALEHACRARGATFLIHTSDDGSQLLAVELEDSGVAGIRSFAVRVDSAAEIEAGATWLFGQISVGDLGDIADRLGSAGDLAVPPLADSATAGASVDMSGDGYCCGLEKIALSAALILSIAASDLVEGCVEPAEIASELARVSGLLAEGIRSGASDGSSG